jgi:hypothetical protein
MNSRGRINCPSESCLAGCSFPTPAWSAPAFQTKVAPAAAVGFLSHGRRLLLHCVR